MKGKRFIVIGVLLAAVGSLGCVSYSMQARGSALEYLYPAGRPEPTVAQTVKLELPLRVGVAFAPGKAEDFSDLEQQQLLERVADRFAGRAEVESIEVIPGTYLTKGGGFGELDRLKSSLGLDLVTLVSFDQHQFSDSTNSSWTYLTVVGAFVVRGEKNETKTMMDAAVFDIPSRALLFRAAGESSVDGRATPIDATRKMRERSQLGFSMATDDLLKGLDDSLDGFIKQAKTGTVRGRDTPAVEISAKRGASLEGMGAGAAGPLESLAVLVALGLVALLRARST